MPASRSATTLPACIAPRFPPPDRTIAVVISTPKPRDTATTLANRGRTFVDRSVVSPLRTAGALLDGVPGDRRSQDAARDHRLSQAVTELTGSASGFRTVRPISGEGAL